MNKYMRSIALPTLLFFTLSTVTAPARAVLPLVAAGVALFTEGSMVANGLAALTVGSVAGIVYLGSQASGSGHMNNAVIDVPLGVGRDRPLLTPAPLAANAPQYVPPVDNNSQPLIVTPIAPSSIWVYPPTHGFQGTTPEASCAASIAANATSPPDPGIYTYHHVVRASDIFYYCFANFTSANPYDGTSGIIQISWTTPELGCLAPYTLSGNQCVILNQASIQKPADGRCQILSQVAGFTIDPQDPDCGSLSATGVTVSPNRVRATSLDGKNSNEVVINGDGTRTITQSKANDDGKTTTVTTINIQPAQSGGTTYITGRSESVVTGQGTAASGVSAAPVSIVNMPPIDFPTDYNREVTQGRIDLNLESIKIDAKTAHDAESEDRTLAGDRAMAIAGQLSAPPPVPPPADVSGWHMPSLDMFPSFDLGGLSDKIPSATACVTIPVTIAGQSTALDPCPIVSVVRPMLNWMMIIIGAMSGLLVFLRPEENL